MLGINRFACCGRSFQFWTGNSNKNSIQCPLDIATLDIAAALPIATSTPVTNLRQYINSDLGYNDLKIQPLCSKIATVNPFEVAIFNGLCLIVLNLTIFKQIQGSSKVPLCVERIDGHLN